MIVTRFDPKHGLCSLSIESADDLWVLRRLVRRGDTVVTRSSRVMKKEEEYSRPDKGERIRVTIALQVEELHLDRSVERLRLRGFIRESSDENVSKSGFHSATISPGHSISIVKEKWTDIDTKLVRSSRKTSKRFILVAIDRREAGVGVLSGSHLSILATFESGLGGKMEKEPSSHPFLSKVSDFVKKSLKEDDTIVLAGPGHTKNALANLLLNTSCPSASVSIVEGLDVSGSDGVRALLKLPSFQKLASDSALVEIQNLVNESVRRISSGDNKVAYTLPRVIEAAKMGAVESCVVSDDVFAFADEQKIVDTLNEVEARGGKVFLADSTLEFGKQISSLGGIVALLRYQVRSY